MIPFICALAVSVLVALAPSANQKISDGELQRLASNGRYPIGCQDSTLAANALKSKPTTDPERLRAAARTYRACATGPYGIGSNALANQANFSASAALLLAARHEPPAAARTDAAAARALAQTIVDYRRPSGPTGKTRGNDPSPLLTDAGRISRDATALLAAIALPAPAGTAS